jgi:polyisoprenoid-binding protein YceI
MVLGLNDKGAIAMDTITTWEIDPAHSTIALTAKHMMFTTVRGRFTRFTGTVRVNEQHPDQSAVEVDIEAASIDTGVEKRDDHLRSGDFLNVEQHPRILFRTTRVDGAHAKAGDQFQIQGTLSIRGTSRPVTLSAMFDGTGKDPWGGLRGGFSARTEIDRRDWGLTWNQTLEAGGMLVSNTIKIEIEIQAVKQERPRATGETQVATSSAIA